MRAIITSHTSILPLIIWTLASYPTIAQQAPPTQTPLTTFEKDVQPLLKQFCERCHNGEEMESGVRVDLLNSAFEDRHLFLWKGILKQLKDEVMPPEGSAAALRRAAPNSG